MISQRRGNRAAGKEKRWEEKTDVGMPWKQGYLHRLTRTWERERDKRPYQATSGGQHSQGNTGMFWVLRYHLNSKSQTHSKLNPTEILFYSNQFYPVFIDSENTLKKWLDMRCILNEMNVIMTKIFLYILQFQTQAIFILLLWLEAKSHTWKNILTSCWQILHLFYSLPHP